MLSNLRTVENRQVIATDGDAGRVVGFLLDDERWGVRYVVVETGGFVGGRRLLVSPISLRQVTSSKRALHVALTIDKIQHTPSIDLTEPISRKQELAYHRYHGYHPYWGSRGLWGVGSHPSTLGLARKSDVPVDATSSEDSEVHLRTDAEIRGYDVAGADGAIGRVADFIVDEDTWEVRYLVVDADPAWGRKGESVARQVLVAPRWAQPVLRAERTLRVDLSRLSVMNSPEWDRTAVIDRAYEARLYAHYQRPGYWEDPVPALA